MDDSRAAGAQPRDRAHTRSQWLLVLAAIAGTACVAAWATALVSMRNRGFDITDEGYYLLSYRWWSTAHRAATGTQYVYGPVFQMLHHDIAALRLFRLLSIVVTNALFAVAFVRWLRVHQPDVPKTRMFDLAVCSAIVASGGLILVWLPLSPGYDDATALGSLLALTPVFVLARHLALGSEPPWWPATATGFAGFVLVLSKWTTVPTVALLLLALAVMTAERGRRTAMRTVGLFALGALLAAAFVHVALVPLDTALPAMAEVNRLAGEGEHGIGTILDVYVRTYWTLATHTARLHAPLFAAAAFAALARGRTMNRVAVAVFVAAFANSVRVVAADGGFHGGPTPALTSLCSALLAMAVAFAVVAAASRVHDDRARAHTRGSALRSVVLASLLVVVPLGQAFGTGGQLWSLAIDAFATWMALAVWFLAGGRSSQAGRIVAVTAAAGVVALSAIGPVDGLLHHPYRTAAYADDTTVVPGDTPLGSLRLPPETAREYAALRSALMPRFRRSPEPIQAFDKMPGLILLLGGRPVGEAWTGPTATARSAAGLVDECRRGLLRRPPVLLYNRSPLASDLAALDECGFRLRRDYRVLRVPDGPPGLTVYLPK